MQYYHREYNNGDREKNEIRQSWQLKQPQQPKKLEVELYNNKWQQLLEAYPQVHITQNAQSLLIKPKDTVVLSEKYHELSTNSFLLHAYYNYRQLLLFRYNDSGEYYIGVPGIYYERQQRIAMMFGFEGFEGATEDGGFGYFMKRVEI
jgi:hypothetical protein